MEGKEAKLAISISPEYRKGYIAGRNDQQADFIKLVEETRDAYRAELNSDVLSKIGISNNIARIQLLNHLLSELSKAKEI